MFLFRRLSRSLFLLSIILCLVSFLIFSKYFNGNSRSYRPPRYRTKGSRTHIEYTRASNRTTSIKLAERRLGFYVHFDLKGAPPKISFFEKLFPLLRQWGVTGVCMEYEDMFPFEGIVRSIQHKQAYTKNEIQILNQLAEDNQLDVMPLLQTYGHLEFLLKLEEFSHLRENIKYPQVISPCLNQTYTVLYAMIDQYMELHPQMRIFHIGNDEVFYFLSHPACEEFKQITGIQTRFELFAHHLNLITQYIKRKSPDIMLLIWHDVLQNLDLPLLKKYQLLDLISPVLWSYREDMSVEGFAKGSQAALFGKYQTLWGATAFKGATDEIATISDVKHYYENQISWIKHLHSTIPNTWKNFHGMILSGWSRYDHFLSLCELLPYSIPTMLYSIAPWQQQFESLPTIEVYPSKLHQYVKDELHCSAPIHLFAKDHLSKPIPKCQFPGAGVYESMITLSRLWSQVDEVESFVDKFVTDIHVKYDYIHIKRGEECLEKLTPVMKLLNEFLDNFRRSMNEIFSEQVAIEWLETYFLKRYRIFKQRYDFIEHAINEQNKAWLPRPIPNLNQFKIKR